VGTDCGGAIVDFEAFTVDIGASVVGTATVDFEAITVDIGASVVGKTTVDFEAMTFDDGITAVVGELTRTCAHGADKAAFFVWVPGSLADEPPHDAMTATKSVAVVIRRTVDEIFMVTLFRKHT
jgi:hypothetical protein